MSRFSIRNPYFVVVVCLIVTVIGLTSLVRMPVDLFPAIKIPQVVVATSLVLAGLLAVPTLLWSPTVAVAIALGFFYTLLNAASRPALLTLLSHVSSEARGAVLGLNITFSSIGWLSSTVVGGYVVAVAGFGGLGVLILLFGAAGAALSLLHWLWPVVFRARLAMIPE